MTRRKIRVEKRVFQSHRYRSFGRFAERGATEPIILSRSVPGLGAMCSRGGHREMLGNSLVGRDRIERNVFGAKFPTLSLTEHVAKSWL